MLRRYLRIKDKRWIEYGSPRWYDRRKGKVAKCRGAFNGEDYKASVP